MADFNVDGKMVMTIFIGAIITIVFLGSIADAIFTQTTILERTNNTVTAPAVNGTLDLVGREVVGEIIINNVSQANGENMEGTGLNIVTGTSASTGLLSVQLTVNDTGSGNASQSVNVSYTYQADGYISDSGGRSVTTLILIFGALAIVVFAIAQIFMGSLNKIQNMNGR